MTRCNRLFMIYPLSSFCPTIHPRPAFLLRHQRLGGPANRRGLGAVKHDKCRLEGDVSKDVDAQAAAALDAAEALRRRSRNPRVVDVRRRDDKLGRPNSKGERREGCRAREHVATVRAAVGGTRNLAVIGRDDGCREIKQRRAGVGDAGDGCLGKVTSADAPSRRSEGPVSGLVIDRSICDLARVLCLINETKVVGAGC